MNHLTRNFVRLLAVTRRSLFACAALGLLTLVVLPGCSDDDDDNPVDPGPQSTQLTGFFLGPFDGGKMTVTIPLAPTALAPRLGGSALSHDVAVTGLLTRDFNATVTLSGTYSEETDSIYVESPLPPCCLAPYVMAGGHGPAGSIPGIRGHYSGPNDPGAFVLAVGGTGTITTYCAEIVDDSGTPVGSLDLIVVGAQVAGVFSKTSGDLASRLYFFDGTITGAVPNQTITVNQVLGEQEPVDGSTLVVEGTLDATAGTITNGTWEIQLGPTTIDDPFGTWDGSTTCQIPPGS